MKELTLEEVKAHSNIEMFFNSYYKYAFTFKGVDAFGRVLVGRFGGDSDDLYRMSVDRDTPMSLGEFDNVYWE